jgi:Xaa-Pro aminopeptidase
MNLKGEGVMMNYQVLKEKMRAKNLDAVIVASPENVLYSTGSWLFTNNLIRNRLAMVLLPMDEDPVFILIKYEVPLSKTESWINDFRGYDEFKESPVDLLIDALKEKKCENSIIGIEKDYFPIKCFEKLRASLPDITFTGCRDIFDELRMIKSEKEIELLSFAARATREAVDGAFLSTRQGDSERDIANRIRSNLFELKADAIAHLCVGAGKRSSLGHTFPDDSPLRKGEIFHIDFGGFFKGYFSDIARIACIEEANDEQCKIYRALIGTHRKVIQNMTIGKRFCDIFKLCEELYLSEGLALYLPHIGHGLGIGIHENPMIFPGNENTLEENMVLCLEHGYNSPEGYKYHIEDTLLIQKGSPKVLTESDLNEQIPIIG